MAIIKDIKTVIRERISECSTSVGTQLGPAVHSIYGSPDGRSLVHIGSAVLISYKDRHLILTAAHVVDEAKNAALHISANGGLALLEGDVWQTVRPKGGRKEDKFDFALWPVSPKLLKQLGPARFLSAEEMVRSPIGTKGHCYLAVGFPNSKQKKIRKLKAIANRWQLMCTAFDGCPFPPECGFSAQTHLFLKFDKKFSTDKDWKRVNSLDPRGVSGGAVLDLGKLSDVESLAKPARPEGRLIGIAIEYHKDRGIIVVTRLKPILPEIERRIVSGEI